MTLRPIHRTSSSRSLLLALCLYALTAAGADPAAWDLYNRGVRAYAERDYAAAFSLWQDLSLHDLPRPLRCPVYFQLGNAQFRLGEPLEANSPEETAELWRRGCAAYDLALSVRPRNFEALHNQAYVQQRLARLLQRLGREALDAAADQPLDAAIPLTRTSLDHLREALSLPVNAPGIRDDHARAANALVGRLGERARSSEHQGDNYVSQTNSWADLQAETSYHASLEDLGEARQTVQPDLAVTLDQAKDRVEQKLANLLNRRGRNQQEQGSQQAATNPDEALDHYETALDLFQQSQQVRPDNPAAVQGEREVRAAMEGFYVRRGQSDLKRGKSALNVQGPQAAPALSQALAQFESALGLNQLNPEAQAGAAEARRLLPEALNLAGQSKLAAGDRAEPRSVTEALTQFQEAEKDFRQSLELKPNQPPAEKGLAEAETKAARALKKASAEAENIARVSQPANRPPKSLQTLLGQVGEKQRTPELDRQRQAGRKDTRPRPLSSDW